MIKLLAIVLVLGAVHAGTASGALVVFTDEADFLGASGPLGFEGFEQTTPGFTGSSRVLSDFIIGPLDANISVLQILNDPAFASEGAQSAGGNTAGMFLVFNDPITAFGLTIVDFGNAGTVDTLQLTLLLSGTIIGTLPVATTSDPFEPLRFFGVISPEPFSGVEIRRTDVQDFFAIDAVRFGVAQSISEPGAHALMLLGLAAIISWRYVACARIRRLQTARADPAFARGDGQIRA